MNEQLRLCAICNYPTDQRPEHQVFVRALLLALAGRGVDITVVAPEKVGNLLKRGTKFRVSAGFEARDGLPIHRPRYLSYSAVRLPWGGTTQRWSDLAHAKAVARASKQLTGTFDLCYSHFLYPHGLAAAQLGERLGIPTVVALGESTFARYTATYSQQEMGQLVARFAGVIANSALIKEYCVERLGVAENKIAVFPNGVNEARFYPRQRKLAREQCNLPQERPIIIFVGQLIDRKGPLRVLEAIRPWPEIGAVFLGKGPQIPSGPQVLYQGAVPHEAVPIWLSAADIFVLPSLDEGCSNAMLEALFCGLPVIAADLPFNYPILNEKVARLVDPNDVTAIGAAIDGLVRNPAQRGAMQQAALAQAASFRLSDRAARIHTFLGSLCSQPAERRGTLIHASS